MQLQTSSEFGEPMSKSTYYSGKVTKNFVLLLPLLVAPAYSSPHLLINWNNCADCTGKNYVFWRKNSYHLCFEEYSCPPRRHKISPNTGKLRWWSRRIVHSFSPSLKEPGGWQDQGTGETFIGCTYLTKAVFRYHLSVAWLSTFDAGLGIWNNTI